MARTSVKVEVSGFAALKMQMKALEEMDAPEIAAALGRASSIADREVRGRARGSMTGLVTTKPGKKLGAAIVLGVVKHPGAKAMEFGRTQYYRGFTGRSQKSGTKFKASRGQKARPFVGIKKGDAAMAAMKGPIERELVAGVKAVWNRRAG